VDVKANRVEPPGKSRGASKKPKIAGRARPVDPSGLRALMLKWSVADRKLEALAKGRDLYLGIA
jgi:hypothetical protein